MKYILLILIIAFSSCAKKVEISGVIVDSKFKRPVYGVKLETIVDIRNNVIETAEAITDRSGRFRIQFETFRTLPDTIPVQLSKDGYRTNMYDVRIASTTDTLILVHDQTLR